MAEDLHRKTISELAALVTAREVSPRDLAESALRRIAALDPGMNALVTVCADQALRAADASTEELARQGSRGPLHGIPLVVKDLTDTAGVRTTYGSSLFREHVPVEDAEPVRRLRAAGAILVGKANTHEFACGTTTDNPHYGATHNPWQRGHVPGGSSGGSAAAVAAGLVPLATGSDTGGSIRIPSALCGCVGMKPSHGRVSLRGTYPMAASCDHVGPIARTALDCAIALQAMEGYDPADPWSRRFAVEDLTAGLERPLRGLRIAVAPDFQPMPLDPGVATNLERAVAALRHLGATIVAVELPDAEEVLHTAGSIVLGETFAQHEEQLARHADAYGADVRLQLGFAATLRAADLVRAQQARERFASRVEHLLTTSADALLLPTVAIEAPPIGAEAVTLADGSTVPVLSALASYTLLHNLLRLPTVSLPAGPGRSGLPTAVQVTTAFAADSLALAIAHQLEPALWPPERRWPG